MAGESSTSLGSYEMLWDCEYCGARGLLGKSQRHCPECGAKQDGDKRYFPEEGAEVRVDGHKYVGADRVCGSCAAPQSAAAHHCTHCGAPLDDAREVQGVAAPVAPAAPRKPRRWWLIALVAALIALAIYGIWYQFLRKRVEQHTITAHHWEVVIPVEEYVSLSESGWRDHVPSDAHGVSCRQKERSSRRVETGEEECRTEKVDKKDGTFEKVEKCKKLHRDEPIYDDWCSYRVERWREQPAAALRATGTGLAPRAPAVPPSLAAASRSARSSLGARRLLAERTQHVLQLGAQRCDVDAPTWHKHKDGAVVAVKVIASSGKIVCSSL